MHNVDTKPSERRCQYNFSIIFPIKIADCYIRSFSLFFLISIPSIKIIYSSPIINIFSIILLLSAVILHVTISNISVDLSLINWWTLFSTLLLITGFIEHGNLEILFRYITLVFFIYAVIIIAKDDVIIPFCRLLFLWGISIATWQIFGDVPTDGYLGQTYLTVAMPIGAAMTFAMTSVIRGDLSVIMRAFYLLSTFFMLYSMSTILGRGALLFSILSFLITATSFVFLMRSSVKRKFWIFSMVAAAVLGVIFTALTFGLRQMGRLTRLFENIQDEPRIEVYSDALEYIYNNPFFGYGFGSSSKLFEAYPHNIFLEVMLHGGIVLFMVFIFIFVLYFKSLIITASNSLPWLL